MSIEKRSVSHLFRFGVGQHAQTLNQPIDGRLQLLVVLVLFILLVYNRQQHVLNLFARLLLTAFVSFEFVHVVA